MTSNVAPASPGPNRTERIAWLVEDVIRRRSAGEQVDADTILDAHRELMPELGEKLRALQLVDKAEQRAEVRVDDTQPDSFSPRTDETWTLSTELRTIVQASMHVPKRIGRYTITRVIASGGMGTVYEAIQDKPRRTVAVKVIKQMIASAAALRRFEYESQLLANLRHPGIAQVYDAGTYEDDGNIAPYFAMEYVPDAKSLTEYATRNQLGKRARLEMFAKVCDAVHLGHQKGIIHRDLKPGNILVDSAGQPKIIDFGVARSTNSDLAVTTIQTEVGQLLGTIQYMSPEQCAGDPDDIDTRSDVYALGVVLYELLCGKRPYDVTGASIFDAVRVIREEQPTKLSAIDRSLRGEVESIVVKALEKDRERRFQSAAELAQDVRRYLVGDTVLARPPSIAYQVRVLVRRNKAVFGAISAVLGVLVIATVVSTSLYFRAERTRIETVEQRDRADSEAETANQVKDFLVGLFYVSDPSESRGSSVTAREILDTGAERIQEELSDQPRVQASLMDVMGIVYQGLGLYGPAKQLLSTALTTRQRELPEGDAYVAESLDHVGAIMMATGQLGDAERLHRQALKMRRSLFGNEHLDVAESLSNLASVLRDKGSYDDAVRFHREALAIRRKLLESPNTLVADSLNNLAELLQTKGDYDAAEPMYREALAMHRELFGDDHPDVLLSMHYFLRFLHKVKQDYVAAETMFREALAAHRKVLPANHPYTAALLNSFAGLLHDMHKCEEAEPLQREALAMAREVYGEEHPRVAGGLNMLAAILRDCDKLAEAERLHREALAMRRKLLGDEHMYVGLTYHSLGLTLTRMSKYQEAEEALNEAYRILELTLGADNRQTIETIEAQISLYEAWGKGERAAQHRAMLPVHSNLDGGD